MTGFAATHTGSLTPSSNPWTFVGTVTWQSDIDPAILPDNEPVVLRLAFTTLSLTGATIAFTTSGSGRSATLPSDGPFTSGTDYTVATPAVVDTANDDLLTGDLLRIDIDTAGTGAKGLIVSFEFEKAAI